MRVRKDVLLIKKKTQLREALATGVTEILCVITSGPLLLGTARPSPVIHCNLLCLWGILSLTRPEGNTLMPSLLPAGIYTMLYSELL